MTHQVMSPGNKPLTILVVDDNVAIRMLLKLRLQHEGYRVDMASNGQEALGIIYEKGLPNLVLLNILMPMMNGFSLAESIYKIGNVPIIFLSALTDTNTKVRALSHYAEDYVSKPFVFAELLARIRRILTHSIRIYAEPFEVEIDSNLRINFTYSYILVNRKQLRLTSLETHLLWLLYSHRGHILSSEFLLANVWPPQSVVTRQVLRSQVRRLRIKIEPNPTEPRHLITVRGQGYYLR